MFVFDWINWSQLKHLLGPEAIVNRDGQCWLGDDPLLSHQDRSPEPHYPSAHDAEYSVVPSSSPSATPPGPMVSVRVTGLCLMTNVNTVNVKHNVGCCPMPFEWWIVHGESNENSENLSICDFNDVKPRRKCFMFYYSVVFVWARPG